MFPQQLAQRSKLQHAVQHFITDAEQQSEAQFNQLACAIFAYQSKYNEMLANYCQKWQPQLSVQTWQQLPIISTDCFKFSNLPFTTLVAGDCRIKFTSSGTTQQLKGQHFFYDLSLYHLAIQQFWQRYFSTLTPYLLLPKFAEATYSSLSNMGDFLAKNNAASRYLIDVPIPHAKHMPVEAVAFFGTALLLLDYMEQQQPYALPTGSVIIQTGGYKRKNIKLKEEDFYQQLSSFFAVPTSAIYSEYGMSEMSSQCYRQGLNTPFQCPPWMRVATVNPVNGNINEHGETGYLVIYDLANIDSYLALQTQDIATTIDDSSFYLIGRNTQAVAKGCSHLFNW